MRCCLLPRRCTFPLWKHICGLWKHNVRPVEAHVLMPAAAPMQIRPVETREGGMALQFEHPTIAGVTVGGWMNRADAQPKIVQARPHSVVQG